MINLLWFIIGTLIGSGATIVLFVAWALSVTNKKTFDKKENE